MCCQVNVTKGTLSQAEIDAYVDPVSYTHLTLPTT